MRTNSTAIFLPLSLTRVIVSESWWRYWCEMSIMQEINDVFKSFWIVVFLLLISWLIFVQMSTLCPLHSRNSLILCLVARLQMASRQSEGGLHHRSRSVSAIVVASINKRSDPVPFRGFNNHKLEAIFCGRVEYWGDGTTDLTDQGLFGTCPRS